MTRRVLLSFVFLLITFVSYSQEVDTIIGSTYYRSNANKYYWKNDPPYPGYWQQDVYYIIKATIDDKNDVIIGDSYKLIYWNNSPYELNELYFHLHQNAFQPGSYYHNLNINNNVKVNFGKNEAQGLGTVVEDLRVNGEPVKTELDNTILKAYLNTPLKPGEAIVITCQFKSYFDTGSMRRRMKMYESFGMKHYDGVQWYPALAVYDRKFGWETEQDLDKEYYGDFGVFDVELTFPQEYIVEATGVLQNKKEVLPDTLRAKLDLKNFAKKPMNEAPSIIIPKEEGKTKTWHFHALNVHNFAFTADPQYRLGELEWNGIKIITAAQEPHASGWQLSGLFTLNVIRVYSQDIGMYAWPKIVIADAKDGMEYPMLTLDNGTYPQHISLLAHEVGHMWFYGMVGNNETYRPILDEGFTQFLTVWSMDRIVGEKRARIGKSDYITKHIDSAFTRYENLYYPYINSVTEGQDAIINTHASMFGGAIRHGGNYGLVYYKTGVMLYNLRYVLGEELYLKAMQYYFDTWKFAHPYTEDFRDAIIQYTQVDLNWFFDQWLETTKFIDYEIEDVDKISSEGDSTTYEIEFEREGGMQMPIDFTVTLEDGRKIKYYIPNTWFVKETDAIVLPKWYGWDLLQPTYKTRIKVPGKIETVEIDPDRYLADVDLTNNKVGNGGISTWEFEHNVPNIPNWTKQRNYWRPDIWYNRADGIQIGPHIEGKYLNKFSYSATAWWNTGFLQGEGAENLKHQHFAFTFNNTFSLNRLIKHASVYDNFTYNTGIINGTLGFEKIFRKQDARNPRHSKVFIFTKYLINEDYYQNYLLYPNLWGRSLESATEGLVNGSINLGFFRNYVYGANSGEYTFTVRVPSIASDYNYSLINVNSINKINVKNFEARSRVFGQLGLGNIPWESKLYLAGANPEMLIENRLTRARGFVPTDWLGYGLGINHFHMGGGLNLRGYAGYLAPEPINENQKDTIVYSFAGHSGASWNLEIDFDKFIKIPAKGITKNLKVDTYLFSDIGILNFKRVGENYWSFVRMDAGIGSSLTIKFTPYDIKPLVFRFDMPFFLNSPPAGSEYWQFRYVVGVNRAF